MGTVRVAMAFPGTVHQAEMRWYDTARWPEWVDGLERIVRVEGDWPRAGARVIWESTPAGRGRVTETVVGYEALAGQQLEVDDDSIRARQSVGFSPLDDDVEVELSLEYAIKQRSIFTAVIDALFIRRAMAASLRATLTRFGAELASDRQLA
jgi:hypothetical protein